MFLKYEKLASASIQVATMFQISALGHIFFQHIKSMINMPFWVLNFKKRKTTLPSSINQMNEHSLKSLANNIKHIIITFLAGNR